MYSDDDIAKMMSGLKLLPVISGEELQRRKDFTKTHYYCDVKVRRAKAAQELEIPYYTGIVQVVTQCKLVNRQNGEIIDLNSEQEVQDFLSNNVIGYIYIPGKSYSG